MLITGSFLAWLDVGGSPPEARALAIGLFWFLGLPFLLLGAWASPGNRRAELGATLITTAIVSAVTSLTIIVLLNDPKFREFMPSDRPMPNFTLSPISGLANLVVIGGLGWLLFQWGKRRTTCGGDALTGR